ncbi:hypothetical protein N9Y48_05355 [Zobellia sp.]|nr:hypothetical protein [Zobellia sp.]
MNSYFKRIRPYVLVGTFSLLAFSCTDDAEDILDFEEEQEVTIEQTELATIFDSDDVSSAADTTIQEIFNNRDSAKSAKEDTCYTAEYTETGFTANFDNCTINFREYIVSGAITVVYAGDNDSYDYTVTYDDFMVDGILLNGTREVSFSYEQTDTSIDLIFDVEVDTDIVFENEREISEKGSKQYRFIYDGSQVVTLEIDGNWDVFADDNTYKVDITSLLEAKSSCDYIGMGVMNLSKNGLAVDVDFGNGSCDNLAEITYPNGAQKTIMLRE